MKKSNTYPMLQALLAAALFGACTPISKLLLGDIEPIPMAAFLYLGSGAGMLLVIMARCIKGNFTKPEARIGREDVKWLAGAVMAGGVTAPIVLMFSLRNTPASTASLLLNFESAATTLIAAIAFREAIGRRIWLAVASITAASIILSWNIKGEWGFSIGALGVILACILWGMDNNFTRNISAKDPVITVIIKGIGAGACSLLLAFITQSNFPGVKIALCAMLLGCFGYGLSIELFILAMRSLGASRASIFFGTAPFVGALLSFLLLRESPGPLFYLSLPIMIAGAVLILGEEHEHAHFHGYLEHEHCHSHDDEHHAHTHTGDGLPLKHTHLHVHECIEHAHKHAPDIHHRHDH